MEAPYIFELNEFPYHKLDQVGLTSNVLEDLPTDALDKLRAGEWSPALPVKLSKTDGIKLMGKARVRLIRLEDDTVDVVFSSKRKTTDLSDFSEAEQELLRKGLPIERKSDVYGLVYSQIDDSTNQVNTVPASIIQNNLSLFLKKFNVPTDSTLKESWDRITFNSDEQLITYGIDLDSPLGIRFVLGDNLSWIKDKQSKEKEYNFGMYGCWIKDEDGNFSEYIPEDEYTPELEEKQRKQGDENVEEIQRVNFHR